jgi:hypothetical protein
MIDPESGARCAIRDSRTPGAGALPLDTDRVRLPPIGSRRAGEIEEASPWAEAALVGYAAAWREMPRDGNSDHG